MLSLIVKQSKNIIKLNMGPFTSPSIKKSFSTEDNNKHSKNKKSNVHFNSQKSNKNETNSLEKNLNEKNLFLNLFKKEKKNSLKKVFKSEKSPIKPKSLTKYRTKDKTIQQKPLKKNQEKNVKRASHVLTYTLKTQQLETIFDFQQFWQNKTYYIFKDLINKKVHIGQHKKYLIGEMQPYIFGYLNNFCIINLNQTIIQLRSALKVLYETISNGGHITIIGTKTAYLDHVELFANNLGLPYVASNKWLGGSLTNFETIERNFNKQLKKEKIDLHAIKKSDPSEPCKETINIQNSDTINYKKLDLFKGLRDMGPSDLLIILNPLDNQNALNEARILGIPVIGLVDINTPFKLYKLIDYPIVANNESLLSVSYFLQLFNFTIRCGLKKRKLSIKEKSKKLKTI